MNNVIKSILPFLLTLFLIGNLSSQSCNDPFQVTISNGNVTDLLNALNLSNANQLPSVSADVLIDGTFTIEQDLVVSDNINFLISDGSGITVLNGNQFDKNGGFIRACSGSWSTIRAENARIDFNNVEISGATTALTLLGGTSEINSCLISSCLDGIYMSRVIESLIGSNFIDVEHTAIIAYQESFFFARLNQIGTISTPLHGVTSDGSFGILELNRMLTQSTGVRLNSSDFEIIDNTIDVQNGGTFDSGIQAFLSSVTIDGNFIFGDTYAGIYLNGNSASNFVGNNRIKGGFDSNILVQASVNQFVYRNEINGGAIDGIRLINAPVNEVSCNSIIAEGKGMDVRSGSSMLTIEGNSFMAAGEEDFFLRDQMGIQSLTGNTDWNVAVATLSAAQLQNNHFTVPDPTDETDPLVPSVSFTQGLFEPETGTVNTCSGGAGPGLIPIEIICMMLDNNESGNSVWTRYYNYLVQLFQEYPENEWSECVWVILQNNQYNDIVTLAQADAQYRSLQEEISNWHQDERANLSLESQTLALEAFSNIKSTLRQTQSVDLSNYASEDAMFELWRNVYLLMHKQRDGGLDEADLNYLESVIALCPEDYGNVVHWAFGLVTMYRAELDSPIGDCSDDLVIRERVVTQDKVADRYKLYPQPAQDQVTITINGKENVDYVIIGLQGKLSRGVLTPGDNRLSVQGIPAGVYVLKLSNDNFKEYAKVTIID